MRALQRRANRRDSERARGGSKDHGTGARTRRQRGDAVWLEEVGEAQRLRGLEEENRRLKQLVADLSLDKEALKAIVRKDGWSLPA